ncbi:isopenicillin N synthase family dioxygenase [Agarilytica rhodophyticola]|uniref:isopenicillin N synthase family dioxygenase n=1 Tax=Agarilytica rhodophyticola TaxID=1737490 RepID=UPI000B3413FD|nr:2OG-Fe(II) oxygenase family protein [Agarilytica rhodophyticola]
MNMQIVDYTASNAAELFVTSLRETGFGVLENHPIEQSLLESIYTNWQTFFNGEEKFDYVFDKEKFDGYFPMDVSETAKGSKHRDIKEFYHVYLNGRVPQQLREEIFEYYNKTSAFAAKLLSWIEEFSPKDVAQNYSQPLSEMIRDTDKTLLRVLHYPPVTGTEEVGAVRAAAHEDINLITILPAANQPGLQVKTKEGEWMDVPCNFGNLIINIGDMLQEASSGYFPSTSHRVINPAGANSKESRISLPLFLHPRGDVVLSERYTADTYLSERLQELGMKK